MCYNLHKWDLNVLADKSEHVRFVDKYESHQSFGWAESFAVSPYGTELKSAPSFAPRWWNSIFYASGGRIQLLTGLVHLNPEIFETAYLLSRGFVWTGLGRPKPLESSF